MAKWGVDFYFFFVSNLFSSSFSTFFSFFDKMRTGFSALNKKGISSTTSTVLLLFYLFTSVCTKLELEGSNGSTVDDLQHGQYDDIYIYIYGGKTLEFCHGIRMVDPDMSYEWCD